MTKFRIFGFSEHAEINIASFAFLMIICYIVTIGYVLSSINNYTRNTCYSEMIQHLYKDLTVTGLMSFLLGMLLGTESLSASSYIIYLVCSSIIYTYQH